MMLFVALALSLGCNVQLVGRVEELQRSMPSLVGTPSTGARLLASDGAAHVEAEGGGEAHASHPHDSLIFLFNAMVIGAGIMHLSSIYPWLQQTVVLFVLGLVFSLVLEGLQMKEHIGIFGDSYDMWMGIDPHLLLFALLPALLAGDAMTIDCHVGEQVMYQCLWLAGPGVVIQGVIAAAFMSAYLGWPFLLSLVTASILCATDPVAVVALLKELGVSPTLTVMIQGESLVNDGTAIVLYTVSYNMLCGASYDVEGIVLFLVKVVLMACALGAFIGYFFFMWIRVSGNRLRHHSGTIQIVLTMCSSYWSFIMAEGVLHISGVLATVTASLVLAKNMWPHVVSPESLHHVWHTIEALGNIVIFFLAGALTGSVMVYIPAVDYLHLLVIYLVLLVIRGSFVYCSRPLLKRLGGAGAACITMSDAAVMTWGGLRGAVGLALAIQVYNSRAPDMHGQPQLDEYQAKRVLFFVSGMAFLTTIVNATTAPLLLAWLGMTGMPEAQLRLLRMLSRRLVTQAQKDKHPDEVTASLTDLFGEINDQISHTHVLEEDAEASESRGRASTSQSPVNVGRSSQRADSLASRISRVDVAWASPPASPAMADMMRRVSKSSAAVRSRQAGYQDNESIVEMHREAESAFFESSPISPKLRASGGETGEMPSIVMAQRGAQGAACRGLPADALLGNVDGLVEIVSTSAVDTCMARMVNKTFLNLVKAHYWRQIVSGDLRPGSEEAAVLLTSVDVALSPPKVDLLDFNYVRRELPRVHSGGRSQLWAVISGGKDETSFTRSKSDIAPFDHEDGAIQRLQSAHHLEGHSLWRIVLASAWFNGFISLAILLNCVAVGAEEALRENSTGSDEYALSWYFTEAGFTLIFTLECILKVCVWRRLYFEDVANVFDFLLVILGNIGLGISTVEHFQYNSNRISNWPSIIRIVRVFRVLRFLRLIHFFHAKLSANKEVDPKLSLHMIRVFAFLSFIGAHLHSQELLLKYFGGDEIAKDDAPELARCILQSQISVYKAIELAEEEEQEMDHALRAGLKLICERKEVTESLEEFVMSAFHSGAIGASEAESILHPLRQKISEFVSILNDCSEGIIQAEVRSSVRPKASDEKSSASMTLDEAAAPRLPNEIVIKDPPWTSRERASENL